MLRLLHLILGYVTIEVRGAFTERFLNLLSQNGLSFWDMQLCELGLIRINMSIRDFKKTRRFAHRTMCHVHIVKKSGLPFFTRRLRGRSAWICGLLIFCTVLWVLSSFIWIIDVEGAVNVSQAEILDKLRENGVGIGTYTGSINHVNLKNDMLIAMPELSFISVNICGSHATVTVRERTPPPEIYEYDTPSNIVAGRAGIISSITVKSGTPEVSPGDAVVENQLLASGYMVGRTGTTVSMRAVADVHARTWHKLTCIMPLVTRVKTYTGNTFARRTLILGSFRINLPSGTGNSHTECDRIIKKAWLTLPGDLKLPIALETVTFREFETRNISVEPDVLFEYISARMEQYIQLDDGHISDISTSNSIHNSAATVRAVAECEENIGREQIIPKGE